MADELERQISALKQGDHVCPIYDSEAEQLGAAVPFVKEGLARGERCLYVADDCSAARILQALAAAGVDVEREQDRGSLRLLTKRQSYLPSATFEPQEMIRFLRWEEADALAAGFAGLRVAGEMTWALGPETTSERLIEFEALLNRFLEGSRSVILCQYNRNRFDPAIIHDVLRTHPVAVLGDQVCPNPYYEPPELMLSADPEASAAFKARRVGWWIEQLKRARAAEQERERMAEAHTARLQALAQAALTINAAGSPGAVAQAVTEAARAIIGAHQAVTGFTMDANWAQSVQAVSLSDKYAAWRGYDEQPDGSGIYAVVCETNRPMRLTQAELEAHPRWRGFGKAAGRHPPLRGWLAAPPHRPGRAEHRDAPALGPPRGGFHGRRRGRPRPAGAGGLGGHRERLAL